MNWNLLTPMIVFAALELGFCRILAVTIDKRKIEKDSAIYIMVGLLAACIAYNIFSVVSNFAPLLDKETWLAVKNISLSSGASYHQYFAVLLVSNFGLLVSGLYVGTLLLEGHSGIIKPYVFYMLWFAMTAIAHYSILAFIEINGNGHFSNYFIITLLLVGIAALAIYISKTVVKK
jgi:hypothetical protein